MSRLRATVLLTALLTAAACANRATFPPHLTGNVGAVGDLLERVLPGSSPHFALSLTPTCPGVASGTACFSLSDGPSGMVLVSATSASELTGGIGVYLREWCNLTIGWPRGGGQRLFIPEVWPNIGQFFARPRSVPYSHVTQVCTHSYTLVWHDWAAWEKFIDWMALAGHNSIVAPTGQEEVQYRVMTEQFGVSDMEVRNWTNGPGFLTWSRGQNSHGNGIAGPLPRSFMKGQWTLQKQILERYRDLGIAGHQPAFGGYAPWALAVAQNDTGKNGATRGLPGKDWDTAWIDGRDPLYTRVADAWMKQIIGDFGSDHVWQMDAFFANGTKWGAADPVDTDDVEPTSSDNCTWSGPYPHAYIADCAHKSDASQGQPTPSQCPSFATVEEAKAACVSTDYSDCHGITVRTTGSVELRSGSEPMPDPGDRNETSYMLENEVACKWDLPPDPVWLARGKAAYGAVARADGPTARWIMQGWMLYVRGSPLNPVGPKELSRLHGFSAAVPKGQFILFDMNENGLGQWKEWGGSWGLPFIWTALHVFGGNQGLKGNVSEINAIPFEAPPIAPVPAGYNPATQAVGVGYTPEGLDQNPAYYELLQEAAFKTAPESDLTAWFVRRAHRRYGLDVQVPSVASAWTDLHMSVYSNDGAVHDGTGVGLMPAHGYSAWEGFENGTPKPVVCLVWRAWGSLIDAASTVATPYPEPYTYDLIDTGREALAQLTIPVSLSFSAALGQKPLSKADLNATGMTYVGLLTDLDRLLATQPSFLLGTWLEAARNLGGNATDCNDTAIGDLACADFMEWNARAQITTWKPTTSPTTLGEPNDYARKQWAGLIVDYYAVRATTYLEQGLLDAAGGRSFDREAMTRRLAELAHTWQTDFGNKYPTLPSGDPVDMSIALHEKYAHHFASCPGN